MLEQILNDKIDLRCPNENESKIQKILSTNESIARNDTKSQCRVCMCLSECSVILNFD